MSIEFELEMRLDRIRVESIDDGFNWLDINGLLTNRQYLQIQNTHTQTQTHN